jgi:hypothetical protein
MVIPIKMKVPQKEGVDLEIRVQGTLSEEEQ